MKMREILEGVRDGSTYTCDAESQIKVIFGSTVDDAEEVTEGSGVKEMAKKINAELESL